MQRLLIALSTLVLTACGQGRQNGDTPQAGCARVATHEVTWSNAAAPDRITARSDGPTCSQAVVAFVVRNADGDALWALASPYYDLRYGGAPPPGAEPDDEAQMDAFLAGWADVTETRTGTLPEWRAGAATLSESAQTFSYDTPFDREMYESLRARDLPMICYASAVEGTQCLIIDPASNAPIVMAAYGP